MIIDKKYCTYHCSSVAVDQSYQALHVHMSIVSEWWVVAAGVWYSGGLTPPVPTSHDFTESVDVFHVQEVLRQHSVSALHLFSHVL